MFQRILVPLDGSPSAEHALPIAANLARRARGSLVLLHVVQEASVLSNSLAESSSSQEKGGKDAETKRIEALERVMTEAASYLALLPTVYAKDLAGVPIEIDVAFGAPALTLPSTAHLEQVDLMVVCSHKETALGQWGLESTAWQVMRHSPVPMLIINEHEKEMPVLDGAHPLRVLVPLDGSLFAEAALAPALQLLAQGAGSGQRELYLLHVVDLFGGNGVGEEEAHMSPYTTRQARQSAMHYLQAVAARLQRDSVCGSDVHVTCLVTSGVDIASAILQEQAWAEASERVPVSLTVLATHGREGVQRQSLGSIAERLLNTTTAPLLTICPRSTPVRLCHVALPTEGRC